MSRQRKLHPDVATATSPTPFMPIDLPQSLCFRVTRYCNARCGFCLAPPDGAHPNVETLTRRIDWLVAHGVRTLHFCGGEPTIHPGLPQLLAHVKSQGGKTKMTTNGISMPDSLLPVLRATGTQVKVSLHGNREHHDAMVGRKAFDQTTETIRRLLAANIRTSVQTTVVAAGMEPVNWVVEFCLNSKVRRLSILPFIPRGNGGHRRSDYDLSPAQHQAIRELIARKRRKLAGRLDLSWLDFSAQPIHVVEADGRVIREHATEAGDTVLCQLP